jgi:signal transduction histidine kinase
VKTSVIRVLRAVRIDDATAAMFMFALGAVVVSRFGRRYRMMAEQMEQAADERGRLLEAERVARQESDEARRHAQARKAELERVTASRAALIRGFSHDVKNPLGAAAGDLQMLGQEILGPLNEKQKESVDRASRSVGAAKRLIQDLLDLASVHTIDIERRSFDLRVVVDEISQESVAQAEMKRLTV